MRVAYLHPPFSFSHDLVRDEFSSDDHVGFDTLEAVVAAVATGDCEVAVVPFYNTTRKSIEESQLALIRHKRKAYVTDVLPMKVRHFLSGFGTLPEITELWSKNVVFHQISKWRSRKLANARLIEYPSTSAAVKAIAEGSPKHAAAVGTRSAAHGYNVPILAPNIQNTPNVTLFFVLRSALPKPDDIDHFLMCVPNAKPGDKAQISDIVAANGCGITSNWALPTSAPRQREAYFFEMNGQFSTLDLHASLTEISTRFPRAFGIGGYKEKCITRLLWEDESPTPKRRR